MEMHQVRYFLAVCDTLNFTRAAERCGVAQPSLTRAIKGLEDELGGILFRRERRQTHLTDLGRLMKPHLEQIFVADEAARVQAGAYWEPEKRLLRLGVMCTIGPGPLVGFLNTLHEQIPTLEVELRDAPGHALIEALVADDIDVAIIGMPQYPETLRALPLFDERYVITFSKGHSFENMTSVPMRALDGADYVWRSNCELGTYFREFTGQDEPFELNIRYRSEREDWIQAMVMCGMGCAIMPEYLPKLPGIATRVLTDPVPMRTISVVVPMKPTSDMTLIFADAASAYDWTRVIKHDVGEKGS